MRRRVPSKSTVAVPGESGAPIGGTRATADEAAIDDVPWSIQVTDDGKRLLCSLPHELCVVGLASLEVERSIAISSPQPTAFEGPEAGSLWIGGAHLYRGSLWSTQVSKSGRKLGGFVDHVCMLRSSLLCGVGSHGEVLWNTEDETPLHQRKVSERPVLGLVKAADGRAVFIDGGARAWAIDPDHPSGYSRLQLANTEDAAPASHGLVALGRSVDGRVILGAADGAVAWTNRALLVVEERHLAPHLRQARGQEVAPTPCGLVGTSHFVYVLRPGGVLDRFVLQPDPAWEEEGASSPLPAARARLGRPGACLAAAGDDELFVGGPTADGHLGVVFRVRPSTLRWEPLPLGARGRAEASAASEAGVARPPPFVAMRSRLEGPSLSELKVDEVLRKAGSFWLAQDHGALLERKTGESAVDEVRPFDVVVLPAMVRFAQGLARPAMLLWPGVPDYHEGEPPPWQLVVWGDAPRGWMPLVTPAIRQQGWSRRDVFPLEVALGSAAPKVAGRRRPLPSIYAGREAFDALAAECKRLLKVLW